MVVLVMWGLVVVWGVAVEGKGSKTPDPCPGGTRTVSYGMVSCLPPAKDEDAKPDATCCAKVVELSNNPACLCACLTSPLARLVGINPIVALSIPKRCNLDSRPVGYQCAGGSVP
ncbi:hypothetical protein GOP47_0008720 [Adiantum capillus-veneris]|uniref:Bifunctional inhibitor/plant lipid transfer protein/seed storage helical domain-containing protein n=1 Tax=Adiantum capillus-veneris TaxID=13818 RepID=A0A9D4UZI1_ADICA|nr:hypothetical protein GOP47_0008720 [Adiantum capillus-veneris]